MAEKALELDHVGIKFNLSKEKVDSLKEYVIKLLKKELLYNEFWALQDISFSVEKGERLGILGLNGAGKSTLLKIIAGVYKPTTGTITRRGKISPLLELGAGFDSQYTGRKTFFSTAVSWDTPENILRKNLTRSWSFPSWKNSSTSPSKTTLPVCAPAWAFPSPPSPTRKF